MTELQPIQFIRNLKPLSLCSKWPNEAWKSTKLIYFFKQLKCCGVKNYTDWYTGTIQPGLSGDVALGCCKDMSDPGCASGIASLSFEEAQEVIYTTGCYTQLVDTIQNETLWLIIGGITLAIVQVIEFRYWYKAIRWLTHFRSCLMLYKWNTF